MEMACIMMVVKHFPNEYCAKAVVALVYIMNLCRTKSMKSKFSQEAWECMNHSVSHLKVFGCVGYAHVPDEVRKKLDKKGQNLFLLVTLKTLKHTSCMIMRQGK